MSSPSMMTSPRLMPIRSTMAGSAVPLPFTGWARCIASAQLTASTTLAEFRQRTVAGQLYDAAVMGGHRGIEHHLAVPFSGPPASLPRSLPSGGSSRPRPAARIAKSFRLMRCPAMPIVSKAFDRQDKGICCP